MRSVDIARNHDLWALVVAALAVSALVVGCGGGGGGDKGGADTTAPMVQVSSYTRLLPATGGTATIDSTATDNVGVSSVQVKVTAPGGHVSTLSATAQGGNVYRASYTAPANPGTTAMTYKFTVYAYDSAGNTGSDGEFSFEVPSAENPPPPPPFNF